MQLANAGCRRFNQGIKTRFTAFRWTPLTRRLLCQRYREPQIKRQFLSGTFSIDDIKDTNTLILKKIETSGPRAFQVKALPSGKVVYWSISRRKANNFVIETVKQYGFNVEFGNTLPVKGLEYSFSYCPNEYLVSFALYMAITASLIVSSGELTIISVVTAVVGLNCFWKYMSSISPYNKQ